MGMDLTGLGTNNGFVGEESQHFPQRQKLYLELGFFWHNLNKKFWEELIAYFPFIM
jgi:hypothetical protein